MFLQKGMTTQSILQTLGDLYMVRSNISDKELEKWFSQLSFPYSTVVDKSILFDITWLREGIFMVINKAVYPEWKRFTMENWERQVAIYLGFLVPPPHHVLVKHLQVNVDPENGNVTPRSLAMFQDQVKQLWKNT